MERTSGFQMGIVIYALDLHQRQRWGGRHANLSPVLAFLEECHAFGASGIQGPLGLKDAAAAHELRQRAERYGMYVEASITPPKDHGDLARFEREVELAQEAGVSLARTVIMPGRRYEQFKTMEEFRKFEAAGERSLQLAEPVLQRRRFRLAVENHKDQRVTEKVAMLERLASEFIGVCVDVGNNLALVEDPLEVTRALAPWALSVHIKDHVVRVCEEGFWLADVALGEGLLDLPATVNVLRSTKPGIRFNFETITRDPILVPVLTDGYWSTLGMVKASELARLWAVVRARSKTEPLVSVSKLPEPAQLALERDHIQRSLAYARAKLEL